MYACTKRQLTLIRSVKLSEDSEDLALFRVTRIFLATTAHCHDWAAIKIHITHFTRIFNDHLILYKNKGVMGCGNPNNFNCFWN